VAGGLHEAEWREVLAFTGFTDIRWGDEVDVFSGSRHESDAAEFETRGVTFAARLAPAN
jgi:hypothetical protein